MKNFFQTSLLIVLVAFALWAGVACMTFAFRHPWATDLERAIHFFDALQFKRVPYRAMRPE
jgi:hypothetical protein